MKDQQCSTLVPLHIGGCYGMVNISCCNCDALVLLCVTVEISVVNDVRGT